MSPRRPDTDSPLSPLNWLVEFLVDRNRRLGSLIGVAYVAAFAGLGVTFLQGTFDPASPAGTVGIGLLAVSFAAFFSASVTILGSGDPPE